MVKRQLRDSIRREVFPEGVEGKCISAMTDSVAAEQNNLTFRQPKSPRREIAAAVFPPNKR